MSMQPRKVAVVWVYSCQDCPFLEGDSKKPVCAKGYGYREIPSKIFNDREIPDWCQLDDMPDI